MPACPHIPFIHLCAPSFICLFSTLQVLSSTTEIEMWGDGKQTRSFTFIDDCVEGILRVTKSDYREPLNLGSDEMVSMNEMMQMAMSFEGKVRARLGRLFAKSRLSGRVVGCVHQEDVVLMMHEGSERLGPLPAV
jgi:nucleoside-diphosphate-sugar epimerase